MGTLPQGFDRPTWRLFQDSLDISGRFARKQPRVGQNIVNRAQVFANRNQRTTSCVYWAAWPLVHVYPVTVILPAF